MAVPLLATILDQSRREPNILIIEQGQEEVLAAIFSIFCDMFHESRGEGGVGGDGSCINYFFLPKCCNYKQYPRHS